MKVTLDPPTTELAVLLNAATWAGVVKKLPSW
jgi:hypothetical protein